MTTKTALKSKALYFTGPRQVEVRTGALQDPAPGDVLIEALASGISAGTERNVYRGLAPQWRKRQDSKTRLFVESGEPDWSYPSRYGYASVGRVVEVGSDVRNLNRGDLVFSYTPHGDYAVALAERLVPLGDLSDPELGRFFARERPEHHRSARYPARLSHCARPAPGRRLDR